MRVEDLTKFEGECPNIVVFGKYHFEVWGGLDEDNNPITGGESKNGFCSPFAVNVYIIENDEGVQVAQIDDVDIIECV